MLNRFKEFFEVQGVYSMRNLTVFIGVVVGSIVVIYLAILEDLTDTLFGLYMAATGGVYSWGKYQDEKTKRCQNVKDDTDVSN